MPLLDALIYGVRHIFKGDGTEMPTRSRVKFTGDGVTVDDDQAGDVIVVDIPGGGEGGEGSPPGGVVGNMQFHQTGGVFAGTERLNVDAQGCLSMPSASGVSNGKTIKYPGPGHSGTNSVPFVIDSGSGSQAAAWCKVLAADHKGVAQIVAFGSSNAGLTTMVHKVIPYTYDGAGTLTLGTPVDIAPAPLVSAHATMVLNIIASGPDSDGDYLIYVYHGGTAGTRVRWAGQIQCTMVQQPP